MIPAISIGPLVLPTAGLVYILGAWFSLSLVERTAKHLNLNAEKVYGVAATALFGGLVGARLTFVAIYWRAFTDNLLGIIWPLNTGYNLFGGLVIGAAAAFFYGRYHQLKPGETLDALAPGLFMVLMVVSLADFLAGPGFGTLSRVPWAITQYSMRRHPVQIYEILVGATALFVWWRLRDQRLFKGQLFLMSVSIYSGGRLLVDAFRDNAWVTSGGYHIVQIICLIMMIGGLYLAANLSEKEIERRRENKTS
ncbi:MAG: prolipoprotein diacylglyceryl transferase [Ardenticatenaceae bacterium]|nr:prolipoprotein diacylglyceryl transferase [Ardenticatenaceae bacterium]MCB9446485.1 prolipoprotein diacylglyceryl transferase [Ardenticatenaceae bacterium]